MKKFSYKKYRTFSSASRNKLLLAQIQAQISLPIFVFEKSSCMLLTSAGKTFPEKELISEIVPLSLIEVSHLLEADKTFLTVERQEISSTYSGENSKFVRIERQNLLVCKRRGEVVLQKLEMRKEFTLFSPGVTLVSTQLLLTPTLVKYFNKLKQLLRVLATSRRKLVPGTRIDSYYAHFTSIPRSRQILKLIRCMHKIITTGCGQSPKKLTASSDWNQIVLMNYTKNIVCTWDIDAGPDKAVEMKYTVTLDSESESCDKDVLYVSEHSVLTAFTPLRFWKPYGVLCTKAAAHGGQLATRGLTNPHSRKVHLVSRAYISNCKVVKSAVV